MTMLISRILFVTSNNYFWDIFSFIKRNYYNPEIFAILHNIPSSISKTLLVTYKEI